MNFTDYGCVVVVVMTHGKNKGILMSRDEPYNEQDILNFFKREKNNTLVNKPVILIIQVSLDLVHSNADYIGKG